MTNVDTELRSRRLILFGVAALLIGTAFAWGLFLAREALQLMYLSVMLSLGFNPLVTWLETRHWFGRKRRLPRWIAILIFYLGMFAIVSLLFLIVVPPMVSQTQDLIGHLPQYSEHVQQWLINHRLLEHQFTLAELAEKGPSPNNAVSGLMGAVNKVAALILTAFTVLLLSFYLLLDGETMFKGLLRGLPDSMRPRWARSGRESATKVGGWMAGQFLLCVLIGTTSAVGFWIIGLPYFYVLALVCGFGELIPMIGPIISAVPAVLVAFTVGGNTALIVTIFLFVQQQVESNIIIPRLMEKQTGISPILVMVAILIGGSLLGALGALLAVPTAAVIQIAIREYFNYRDEQ